MCLVCLCAFACELRCGAVWYMLRFSCLWVCLCVLGVKEMCLSVLACGLLCDVV